MSEVGEGKKKRPNGAAGGWELYGGARGSKVRVGERKRERKRGEDIECL